MEAKKTKGDTRRLVAAIGPSGALYLERMAGAGTGRVSVGGFIDIYISDKTLDDFVREKPTLFTPIYEGDTVTLQF